MDLLRGRTKAAIFLATLDRDRVQSMAAVCELEGRISPIRVENAARYNGIRRPEENCKTSIPRFSRCLPFAFARACAVVVAHCIRDIRSRDVTRLEYTNCANDAAVVLYPIQGGGHAWPGGNAYVSLSEDLLRTRND